MDSNEFVRLVLSSILSIAGAAAIIAGLSVWLGKIWAERIYLKTNAKYQQELERLKNSYAIELESLRSDTADRREFLKSASDVMASGYTASQERRLKGIEELWGRVRSIHKLVSPLLVLYDFTHPDEYKDKPNERVRRVLPTITPNELTSKLLAIVDGADANRPFVGEDLWLVYRSYSAFAGRITLKLVRAVHEKKKIPTWDSDFGTKDFNGNDDSVFGILRAVFTEEEIHTLTKDTYSVPETIMRALEAKMLDRMNELIFGKPLINVSFDERQRLNKVMLSGAEGIVPPAAQTKAS